MVNSTIYLWKKIVCLSHWDLPNHNSSCLAHGTIWKLSMIRGAMSLFHYVSIYNKEVIEYWRIFSLKINFIGIVGKPLVAFYEGDLEILRLILDEGPGSNFVWTHLKQIESLSWAIPWFIAWLLVLQIRSSPYSTIFC